MSAPNIDFNKIGVFTFFVDDYRDFDPKTKNASPGKVDGQQLNLIAYQFQRTWNPKSWFGNGQIKNWIYRVGSSRTVVYKQGPDNPGVCLMGISINRQDYHPNAVPMEMYAKLFIDRNDGDADVVKYVHAGGVHSISQWMAQNAFKLL